MPLCIIDYKSVQRDMENGITRTYNTNFHTEAQAPGYPIPSNKPFDYETWLPLILSSRDIPASDLQIVALRRAHIELLVRAAAASIHTRELNRAYAEDLEEEVHPAFQTLRFPPEGLFMRLGACSPKDGAHTTPGVLALRSVEDIVLRMTTSLRTWSALTNILNSDAEEAYLYFLPFDSRLQSSREYRVFCCPESLQVTAVSQYEWHKPWILAEDSQWMMAVRAQSILGYIGRVHDDILEFMRGVEDRELESVIRSQGFTFDVFFDQEGSRCRLIELNTFGLRSACGSCLFNWVQDRDLLYGEKPDVEFRVTVNYNEAFEDWNPGNASIAHWLNEHN